MVKAMADASVMLDHGGVEKNSIFFPKFNDVKPGVAIEITKKFRPSLRSLFFSSSKKAKRKDTREGEDERQYLLDEFARQRITDVDLDRVCDLPTDIDLNEWLATHMIKFYEHINYLYGAISDFCTCVGCANMVGPNNVQYQWVDDKGKKVKVTAPQYIEYVTAYTQKTICDETVFPTKYGNVFPATFEATVKKISRLLLHVLAHIYHTHFAQCLLFNLQGFINTVTAHFILFCKRFSLLDNRELEPMEELYQKLMSVNVRIIGKDDSKTSLSSGSDKDTQSRTSAAGDNVSQSSLSGVHDRQNVAVVGGLPVEECIMKRGSNGSIHFSAGKASLNAPLTDVEENKENLLQLSSTPPVLTTQPNGHPRTPST